MYALLVHDSLMYGVIVISREVLVSFHQSHHFLSRADLQSLREPNWVRDSVSVLPLTIFLYSTIMKNANQSQNDTNVSLLLQLTDNKCGAFYYVDR